MDPWVHLGMPGCFSILLSPVQTGNIWRSNTIDHCLATKHFFRLNTMFDRVGSCLIKYERLQTFDQTL